MKNKFDWAVNQIKVDQSIKSLNDKKAYDKTIEINEDTIKEEYVKRGGLLSQDNPYVEVGSEEEAIVIPKATKKTFRAKK